MYIAVSWSVDNVAVGIVGSPGLAIDIVVSVGVELDVPEPLYTNGGDVLPELPELLG